MKYNPLRVWLPSGIIFGCYVGLWLNQLNNLYLRLLDAGLLIVYSILVYAGLAVALGFIIQFILFDLRHIIRIRLTPEKTYFLQQLICLTLLFYLPSRFGCQTIFGNPSGFYKLICNLFFLIIVALFSWIIIHRYNLFSQKLRRGIIIAIYFIIIGFTLSFFAFFRTEAQHQSLQNPISSTASSIKNKQKIMLIGIDAADWKVINPLIQQNKLPHLTYLIKNGVSGKLATLRPSLSPLVWTSIATGKLPPKHGIHSFLCLTIPSIRNPIYYHEDTKWNLPKDNYIDSLGFRWIRELLLKLNVVQNAPVSANIIQTSTIWEILSSRNKSVGIVGWWPSWPVNTDLNGFMVVEKMTNTIRPNSIHPAYLENTIRHFEKKPEQLKIQDFQQFFSLDTNTFKQLRNTEPYAPSLLAPIKRYFIEDDFYFNSGKILYRKFQPGFFALYLRGIDGIQHVFWHTYEPEKFPKVSRDILKSDAAKYGKVIENYYIYTDKLIGDLLEEAESDTAVIIVSDHGFEASGTLPISGQHYYALPGIIILAGPQFKKNYKINNASVLDITPTILAVAGLPNASDMDGKILTEAFVPEYLAKLNLATTISSYDGINKKQVGSAPTPYDDEIKERLRALGYIQ